MNEAQLKALAEQLGMTIDKVKSMVADVQEKSASAESVTDLATVVKSLQADLAAKGELIADLEEKAAAPAAGVAVERKSAMDILLGSDQYKSAAASGANRMAPVVVKSLTSANMLGQVAEHRLEGITNPIGHRRLYLRDTFAAATTISDTIQYSEQTNPNLVAGMQIEGSAKKESTFDTVDKSDAVETVAHWIRASKQIWADSGILASYVNNEMPHGIKLKEDQQFMYGDGNTPNVLGLFNRPVQTIGSIPAGSTKLDHIRRAITKIQIAEFDADTIYLNPVDWQELELLKDNESRYIKGVSEGMVWGLRVVVTNAVVANDFILGEAGKATVFTREDATIAISEHDGDNFTTNRLTIRGEERIAFNVRQPQAFVKGDFTQLV